MAILGSKTKCAKAVATPWYAWATGGETGKVPKGYIPMMLVDGDDDEQRPKDLGAGKDAKRAAHGGTAGLSRAAIRAWTTWRVEDPVLLDPF